MLRLLRAAVFLTLTTACVELALRAFPTAIPTNFLKRFERGLRLEIAQRRHLPNESQTRLLPRDDGGPPIRLFLPFSRVPFEYEDTGESGEMIMDALGFCNAREDKAERDSISLLAIGDSFTVCHPPAPGAAWPSQLGRHLGVTAYNLGRGGYGPYEYVQILRAIGVTKKPSTVVMLVYEGNDLRDSLRYWAYRAGSPNERARLAERASLRALAVDPARYLANPLGRHSYAYNLAVVCTTKAVSTLIEQSINDGSARADFRYWLEFAGSSVRMNVRNTDEDEARIAIAFARGEVDFDALGGALASYAALARSHAFLPVVAYAPSAHTAYARFVRFDDPSVGRALSEFSEAQREYLDARTHELGLEFVDLTPELQAAAARDRDVRLLYFPINLHFSPAGHEVVADVLARFMER